MTIRKQLQDRIEEMASELRRELWASGVPTRGTKFTQIEDDACAVGDALARALVGQGLEQQSVEHAAGPCECAVCGRSAEGDDLEPRLTTTRRGDVVWRERRYYCKHCRRAFFPSGERPRP
jgi:predicted SprT family Zn-dependent metalloprotease